MDTILKPCYYFFPQLQGDHIWFTAGCRMHKTVQWILQTVRDIPSMKKISGILADHSSCSLGNHIWPILSIGLSAGSGVPTTASQPWSVECHVQHSDHPSCKSPENPKFLLISNGMWLALFWKILLDARHISGFLGFHAGLPS